MLTLATDLERRARGDVAADATTIHGLAIPFGVLSDDLGGFRELFEPEAVDRTLAEQIDVRALVDHDPAKIIGRVKAGTLVLGKRADGLHVTIRPPDTTTGRDIRALVERGDVSGMSIGFHVLPGGERVERRDGGLVRVVTDARIVEASIVTWPAYQQTDASVAQRSLAAFRAGHGARIAWLRARLLAG
jgi:HK97 family phage prohead protease